MNGMNEKTQEDLYEEELYNIETEAIDLSKSIILKLAKKIILTMNRDLNPCIKDDYFCIGCKKFFDQYSIEIQSLFIDEILSGLDNAIEDWIDIDIDNLNSMEKFILRCSTLTEERMNGTGLDDIHKRVRAALNELAWEHYNTVRIQAIVRRAYWI